MKTNKKIYLSSVFLLIGILMMGSVFAFAVSSKYWEENPLTINPGETQKAFIILQNMAGTEIINARVSILSGSEIATMDEPNRIYEIPVGEKVQVNFTVSVPLESQIGGSYSIILDISTVNAEGGGPMTFGTGMQKIIPVLITEEPKEKTSPGVYYLIVGILLLLAVIVFIILKKNKKKK